MTQEAYPGADMVGGSALREYITGKSTFTLTDQQKKAIYTAYIEWSSQVFDDLEDKSLITAEELVYKVLELAEKEVV